MNETIIKFNEHVKYVLTAINKISKCYEKDYPITDAIPEIEAVFEHKSEIIELNIIYQKLIENMNNFVAILEKMNDDK